MTNEQIKKMVQKFLMWSIPGTFCPDGGISFNRLNWIGSNWPRGTNLFSAEEAEEMIGYILEGVDVPPEENVCKGSWALENNCKTCSACVEELPSYANYLRENLVKYKKDVSDGLKTLLSSHVTDGKVSKSFIRANLGQFILPDPKIEQVYVTLSGEHHLMTLNELARLIQSNAQITNIVAISDENGNNVKVDEVHDA